MVCVTDKKVVSVNLNEDLVEYLDQVSDNRSAFVNKLLKAHQESGSVKNDVVADFRRRQLKQEKAAKESQLQEIEKELEAIEDVQSAHSREQERVVEEAAEKLVGLSANPEGEHIKTWAKKAGMRPEEFAKALEEEREEQA